MTLSLKVLFDGPTVSAATQYTDFFGRGDNLTNAAANPEVWGFVISLLLILISVLLTAHYTALRAQITEQKKTNERLWENMGEKVSNSTCLERIAGCAAKEDLPKLEREFKMHSHTELSPSSVLYIKESPHHG